MTFNAFVAFCLMSFSNLVSANVYHHLGYIGIHEEFNYPPTYFGYSPSQSPYMSYYSPPTYNSPVIETSPPMPPPVLPNKQSTNNLGLALGLGLGLGLGVPILVGSTYAVYRNFMVKPPSQDAV
jgi:hypothetical protein